jgi:signal transduction histidine kinase
LPPDASLAQALHEGVAQRLTGVAAALSSVADLTPADRHRCAKELDAAIAELRTVMQQGAANGADAPELEHLIRDFVVEGVRNAEKHASPRMIAVMGSISADRIQLEVLNDGVEQVQNGNGTHLGLRLIGAAAARRGGRLDTHRLGDHGWRTSLTVPRGDR